MTFFIDRRLLSVFFFSSSRRRHTRLQGDWSSDVCSSDLVIDRGTPSPAWRADGTAAGGARSATDEPSGATGFAWNRLTPLDSALSVARANGWRVVGYSGPRRPTPLWSTYERELSALFARHGYRWRIRRMAP